jgi:hypothetical protein
MAGGMVFAFAAMNLGGVFLSRRGVPFWGLLAMFAFFVCAITWAAMRVEKIVVHVPRGHFCGDCGYSLRGVTSERCPECGREFIVPRAVPLAEPVTGGEADPRT